MQHFKDETIAHLLAGTDQEIDRALVLIDQKYRQRMCGWLGRYFPSMTADDLADAWSETLLGVLNAARHRRFRAEQPLLPWLFRIVRARGVDHARRQETRDRMLAALQALVATLRRPYAAHPDLLAQTETRAVVLSAITRLPALERLVLQLFLETFPQPLSLAALAEQVSQRTGKPHSPRAIKRALPSGRVKLRTLLCRMGLSLAS